MDQEKLPEGPQRTVQMLECGDLALNFEVEYGILMVGLTKAGKTTCGHYLTRQVLEGKPGDTSNIYKVKQTSFPTAKIGMVQSDSETEIPNFFYPSIEEIRTPVIDKQGKRQVDPILIDCPGYGDSYGCYRIISNAYFNYRTYSKVKNIKYIVVVEWKSMQGVAKDFTKTLKQFFSGFIDFDRYKGDIFKATCLMITKVPTHKELQDVQLFFRNTFSPRGFSSKEKTNFEEFRKDVLQKNKLFLFKEAQLDQICKHDNQIIAIHKATQYWCRLDENKKIDINCIKISASDIIDDNIQSDQDIEVEWQKLLIYYQREVLNPFIRDLENYFTSLIDDAFSKPQKKENMVKCIRQIVKNRVTPLQKESKLYHEFQGTRTNVRDQLFKRETNISSSSSLSKPMWLKKISLAQKISDLIEIIREKYDGNQEFRMTTIVKNLSSDFFQIIKGIQQMFPNFTEGKKAAYYLYRVLEMTNVFVILTLPERENQTTNFDLFVAEYPRNLFDLPQTVFFGETFTTRKMRFFKNLDFSQVEIRDTPQNFLNEFLQSIQLKIKPNNSNTQIPSEEKILVTNLIRKNKYELKINDCQRRAKNLSNQQMLYELLKIHFDLENQITEMRLKMEKDENLIASVMKVVNMIGDCLLKANHDHLAFECFRSVNNAFRIITHYEEKYDRLKHQSSSNVDRIQFLFEYMEAAKTYERRELAIALAQEAFNRAQMMADFKRIEKSGLFIQKISNQNSIVQPNSFFFTDFYYDPLKKSVYQKICQIGHFESD